MNNSVASTNYLRIALIVILSRLHLFRVLRIRNILKVDKLKTYRLILLLMKEIILYLLLCIKALTCQSRLYFWLSSLYRIDIGLCRVQPRRVGGNCQQSYSKIILNFIEIPCWYEFCYYLKLKQSVGSSVSDF